jgi:hypothetical protein
MAAAVTPGARSTPNWTMQQSSASSRWARSSGPIGSSTGLSTRVPRSASSRVRYSAQPLTRSA